MRVVFVNFQGGLKVLYLSAIFSRDLKGKMTPQNGGRFNYFFLYKFGLRVAETICFFKLLGEALRYKNNFHELSIRNIEPNIFNNYCENKYK